MKLDDEEKKKIDKQSGENLGKNDRGWNKLFEKYDILENIQRNGEFFIKAEQIKEFREPRLMTKFDHKINLPKIFRANKLAILPVTRGEYIVSSFKAYKNLPKFNLEDNDSEIERIFAPTNIQSLTPQNLRSETMALNYANLCGMLDKFLDDEQLVPTVSGRMGGGSFEFNIARSGPWRSKKVKVKNPQIEIDAAYEGVNFLTLFEAKRDNIADDFLIRQLYYPFRTWRERVTKPIKTVFMVYANGNFDFYQYGFEDPLYYNSLYLIKKKRFIILAEITLQDIQRILREVQIEPESPNIPFPQADRMSRVVNLLEILNKRELTSQEITEQYAFTSRQTYYYTSAGRYLGLITKYKNDDKKTLFKLSRLGKQMMTQGYSERQLTIVKQVLKHSVFNEILQRHLVSGVMPARQDVVELMKNTKLYKINSDETYDRRARTVIGWINWILQIVKD